MFILELFIDAILNAKIVLLSNEIGRIMNDKNNINPWLLERRQSISVSYLELKSRIIYE